MTISSSGPGWVYTVAAASQVQFAVPFPFFLHTDLEVYENSSLATGYAVSGGSGVTGTVTFYTPRAEGSLILIRRVTARRQLQDYPANDPFNPAATEAVFDKLVLMVQDLLEELGRRPALAVGIAEALRDLEFPYSASGEAVLIGWNANRTALTLYPPSIIQVTPDEETGLAFGKASATVTASGGASVLTAAALIPAGVRVLGITVRVTTGFGTSNGLSAFDVGGMGIIEGWGSGIALAAGTVTGVGDFTRGDIPPAVNAEDVTLTATSGAFDGVGAAIVTAHFVTLTPDT